MRHIPVISTVGNDCTTSYMVYVHLTLKNTICKISLLTGFQKKF